MNDTISQRPGSPVAVQRGPMDDAMTDIDRLIARVEAGEFRRAEGEPPRHGEMQYELAKLDMDGAVMLLVVQSALRNSDAECAAVLRAYREGGGA